jgi:hypothetical protein
MVCRSGVSLIHENTAHLDVKAALAYRMKKYRDQRGADPSLGGLEQREGRDTLNRR